MDRSDFLKNSLFSGMALGISPQILNSEGQPVFHKAFETKGKGPEITDTNINLFEWPLRTFKYSNTRDIVDKLNHHKISQAWAGSFESLFHENTDLVNSRLTEECSKYDDTLLPIGTVNTNWSDWEEDLRRCDESYQMNGIRIYPGFQMIRMDSPEFLKLVAKATKRNMFIQIVGEMSDPRHRHPLVEIQDFKFDPIVEIANKLPEARIQLLHWKEKVDRALLEQLVNETEVVFDISSAEGVGEVGRLIEGETRRYGDIKIPSTRLLFGSHMPYFIVEAALFRLFESPLTKSQFRSVAVENATQFLTN